MGRRGRLLLVGVLVGVSVASAQAATSTKFYSVTITPTTVEDSSPTATNATLTVTLNNSSTSTQTLGSANVDVPTGFSNAAFVAGSINAPSGKSWTVAVNGSTIEFRAATSKDGIAPGTSVSAKVTATTPAATGDYTFATRAKQSNSFSGSPGNDFINEASNPVVTVVGEICTSDESTCELSNGTTKAQSATPAAGDTLALTLETRASFICDGVERSAVGSIAVIEPTGYDAPFTVTLRYTKAASANVIASKFVVCFSKDGVNYTALSQCATTPVAPCVVSSKRVDLGDLEAVVLVPNEDPYFGGS